MNLSDLHTFSLVAREGTLTAAARRLGVPKSTVSRRIRRLEDALGHDLLRRAPRSIALTEHGEALHRRTRGSLEELQAALAQVEEAGSEPAGTLKITTVPGFGQSLPFVRCLGSFGQRYPAVTVELELTTRVVALVEEGVDVGVRMHAGPLPGNPALMSRRLLRFTRRLYASPAYLGEMGAPDSLEALRHHRLIAHAAVDLRPFPWHRDGAPVDAPRGLPGARWVVNDAMALERFAVSGAGVALLSSLDGDRLVAQGDLAAVLPEFSQAQAAATLVWPASRHLAPRVRAFIDHAVAHFGD